MKKHRLITQEQVVCDRCGREIHDVTYGTHGIGKVDLCYMCGAELQAWLMAQPEIVELQERWLKKCRRD